MPRGTEGWSVKLNLPRASVETGTPQGLSGGWELPRASVEAGKSSGTTAAAFSFSLFFASASFCMSE